MPDLRDSLHTAVDALAAQMHRRVDEILDRDERAAERPRGVRICIDPGHGGHDTGAVAHGIEEKRLVLKYALELGGILEARGHTVKLTRVTDEHVPLRDRAILANEWGADCFVSVHANASVNPRAHGAWVLHDDLTAEGDGIALAHRIFEALAAVPGVPDADPEPEVYPDDSPWVGGRDLAVLGKTVMPAVLVELGFLTHEEDAQELLDEGLQTRICEAIADGVGAWVRERRRVTA